jgi:SMI1 / KNR4 family (SUKH-1)
VDELIEKLRTRAADPERRADVRPTQLWAGLQDLDFGGLLGALRDVQGDLARHLEAMREGRVDERAHERAQEIERAMITPIESELPPSADRATVDALEAELGFSFPDALRRVYCEVANGGFGPGEGLLSLEGAAERYHELRLGQVLPRGAEWPEELLPVVDHDPSLDCVECSTGRVLNWDPEELAERSTPERFSRSFTEIAPNVEAWLADWVESETLTERQARLLQNAQEQALRNLDPELRRKLGLSDEPT